MTNGVYRTDLFMVEHHTSYNPDSDFGGLQRLLCESQKPTIVHAWVLSAFHEHGADVRKVDVEGFAVIGAGANDRVPHKHYVIKYGVRVEHDPITLPVMLAIVNSVALLLFAIALVYSSVVLAPVFAKHPVLLGLLLTGIIAVAVVYAVKR